LELVQVTSPSIQLLFPFRKEENPDLFTYDEVMSDSRRLDEWKASAPKEITQLEAKEVWDE